MKLRDYNCNYLYDFSVSRKDSLEITKLKKGEKPSIVSDSMFKTMFLNEGRLKYSAKFISYFLDIDYDELLSNIRLTNNELGKYTNKSKGERCDYVASINNSKINIEVNNNQDRSLLERNMEYAFRLYASKVKSDSKYDYTQIIQFNLNNFSFNGNDKVVDIYSLCNDSGIILSDKIIFVQIYIPNLIKEWYTLGIQKLDEKERYLLVLLLKNINVSKELGGDISIMKEYVDEAEKVMDEEFFGESYDKELAFKELCINEGMVQGLKQGKKNSTIEIAKSLLNKAVDINIISECTGLSKNELKKLV